MVSLVVPSLVSRPLASPSFSFFFDFRLLPLDKYRGRIVPNSRPSSQDLRNLLSLVTTGSAFPRVRDNRVDFLRLFQSFVNIRSSWCLFFGGDWRALSTRCEVFRGTERSCPICILLFFFFSFTNYRGALARPAGTNSIFTPMKFCKIKVYVFLISRTVYERNN